MGGVGFEVGRCNRAAKGKDAPAWARHKWFGRTVKGRRNLDSKSQTGLMLRAVLLRELRQAVKNLYVHHEPIRYRTSVKLATQ